MKRIHVLTACMVLLAGVATAQRLPQTTVPENYKLTFTPDFGKDNFAGEETIQVKFLEPSSQVVLNSAQITIREAWISSGSARQRASVTVDNEKETVTLTWRNQLPAGPATLFIKYTGILNNEMRGFYGGKDDHGRKYASTQFESTDARRAFPCFDEPAYKATFDITIVADKGLTAIANTSVASDTAGPGNKHTVRFSTTQKISSYLVAFAVGKFDYVEGEADGIPIRVYNTPEKKELGRFALEASENFLKYFNQYFGIKYPYGKLDLIGLPDFSAGAMENVGLITFREVDLQLDKKTASLAQKKSVAITVSHEIAHEWFGDLVTMQWWDDVWLNEGFATWMESKPIEAWKPEWHVLLDEVSRGDVLTTFGAMNIDSLANTRPIHQAADTPAQIQELFDGIAYGKAAAVLRMIEAYLGPQDFEAGVVAYLKEHAYGNATAQDFWTTLARVSKKPVDQIMPTFVNQPGVPLISVKASCADNTTVVNLKQQRYYFDRTLLNGHNDQMWQVPVCMKTAGQPANQSGQCEVLTAKEGTYKLPGCSGWVVVNGGGTGYYRASYQSEVIRNLASDSNAALTPLESIMLLSDVWASVRVGRQPVGDYLTMAESVRNEHTSAVLGTVINQVNFIGRYLVNDSDRANYEAWVRNTFTPVARSIGWERASGEPAGNRTMRAGLLRVLGITGRDPETLAEARKLSEKVLGDPTSVDSDLAAAALAVAASNGDAAFYDNLMAHLKTARNPEEYYRYFYTLTDFSDPQLLDRTLRFAISSDVRSQDALGLISGVMVDPAGEKLAWDFVRAHWAEVEKAGGPFASAQIVNTAGAFCDAQLKEGVNEFLSAHRVPAAERAFRQSMERISSCVDMKTQQSGQLASWLDSRGGGSPARGASNSQ
jgi:aminopeptidase N